ncbi:MAG: hypothetical protein MI866_05855 [Bacteroidales bacterium]|nr:hypothetical protein [Bacteroidales bacterium]
MQLKSNYIICATLVLLVTFVTSEAQSKDSLQIVSYIQESINYLENDQYEKSRDVTEKIIKIDKSYGETYLLLGIIYVTYANECDSLIDRIEKDQIYSLAIDMFEKAKKLDDNCEARANQHIEIYSNYLTSPEIFISVYEGQEIYINGWINRKTKFRFRK